MTRHTEGTFRTDDGLELYRQSWHPDGEPRAVIMLVHGLAEHSGRYASLAGHLASNGYAVEALDLRGHGRSPGKRAYVRSYDELMSDLARFRAVLEGEHPGRPLVPLGHSMGGNLVMGHLLRSQDGLAGAVLSGPALVPGDDLNPIEIKLAPLLGRIAPGLRVTQLDASAISRDPAVVEAYRNDPLVFTGKVSAGLGAALLGEMRRFPEHYPELRVPLLILHGTGDTLASVEGSRRLEAAAVDAEVTAHYYDGWYHEVFNEPGHAQVFDDLTRWLDDVVTA